MFTQILLDKMNMMLGMPYGSQGCPPDIFRQDQQDGHDFVSHRERRERGDFGEDVRDERRCSRERRDVHDDIFGQDEQDGQDATERRDVHDDILTG